MMPALSQAPTPTRSSPLAMLAMLSPQAGGEAGGFDRLVAGQARAAVPAATPSATAGAPDLALPAPAGPATPELNALASAAVAQPAQISAEPGLELAVELEVDAALPAPATKSDAPAAAAEAVAVANWLAGTVGRFVAPTAPQAGKPPVAVKPGESVSDGETIGTDTSDAVSPVVAMPLPVPPAADDLPAPKPTADAAALAATPQRDATPTLQTVTAKSREAAAALPTAIAATVEAPVARPTSDPSMTILFNQPAAPAAGIAEAAAPVAVAERVLDLTSDDGWIEQLASDIAATKSASGEVSFRLMPRHLGRLDVAMIAGDEGVSVRMDTHHEATATIVAAAQVRLVDDLRQQGVRVADTQVTCTPGETGRQSQQGQGHNPGSDSAHLIETAHERAEPRDDERADRRGRFA